MYENGLIYKILKDGSIPTEEKEQIMKTIIEQEDILRKIVLLRNSYRSYIFNEYDEKSNHEKSIIEGCFGSLIYLETVINSLISSLLNEKIPYKELEYILWITDEFSRRFVDLCEVIETSLDGEF